MARRTDIIDLTKLKPRTQQSVAVADSTFILPDGYVSPIRDIWNRFDRIICIHYLPYVDRFENIKSELKRVGILDLPQFEWYFTVGNKYCKFSLNGIPHENIDKEVTDRNIQYTIDSYSLLSKLNHCGYQHVLVVEDDVAFRNDIGFIADVVKSTPNDFDIVNYDPWIYEKSSNFVKCGKHLYKYQGGKVFCTSCIAFSRKGIDYIIREQNKVLRPFDHYTWIGGNDLNKYCAIEGSHVCIQDLGYSCRQNSEDVKFKQMYPNLVLSDFRKFSHSSPKPMFSICIPAYNASSTIVRCIDSAVNQTFGDFEVVVVDDGSTDGQYEMMKAKYGKDARFKILRHDNNMGSLASKVNAIANSSGTYVVVLDADDTLQGNALQRLKEKYDRNGQVDIVQFCASCQDKGIQAYFNCEFGKFETNAQVKNHFIGKIYPRDGKMCHNVISKSYNGDIVRYASNAILGEIKDNGFKISMSDDLMINSIVASRSNTALFIDEKLYNYSLGGMSTSRKVDDSQMKRDICNTKDIINMSTRLKERGIIDDWTQDKIERFLLGQIVFNK